MERFTGFIGIALILGIAFLVSDNRKLINKRLVLSGLALQTFIAVMILKVPFVNDFFQWLGNGMKNIELFAKEGANFVYGGIAVMDHTGKATDYRTPGVFVFAFNITSTIILVCVLVAMLYHFGIMQRVVGVIAKAMNFLMRVSGAEA